MSVVSLENHQILLREFIVCTSLTCNSELIVQLFFQHYVDDSEDVLVESAIGAIGYCARVAADCTQQALSALMTFIQSKHGQLVLDLATFAVYLILPFRYHSHERSAGIEIFGSDSTSATAFFNNLSTITISAIYNLPLRVYDR